MHVPARLLRSTWRRTATFLEPVLQLWLFLGVGGSLLYLVIGLFVALRGQPEWGEVAQVCLWLNAVVLALGLLVSSVSALAASRPFVAARNAVRRRRARRRRERSRGGQQRDVAVLGAMRRGDRAALYAAVNRVELRRRARRPTLAIRLFRAVGAALGALLAGVLLAVVALISWNDLLELLPETGQWVAGAVLCGLALLVGVVQALDRGGSDTTAPPPGPVLLLGRTGTVTFHDALGDVGEVPDTGDVTVWVYNGGRYRYRVPIDVRSAVTVEPDGSLTARPEHAGHLLLAATRRTSRRLVPGERVVLVCLPPAAPGEPLRLTGRLSEHPVARRAIAAGGRRAAPARARGPQRVTSCSRAQDATASATAVATRRSSGLGTT